MPYGKHCGSDLLSVVVEQYNKLLADVTDLKNKYNAVVTLVNELKADLSGHTHGGVTAGTDSTAAGPTISAANAVTASITAEQITKIP